MNKYMVRGLMIALVVLGAWGAYNKWQLNKAQSQIAHLQVSQDSTSKLKDSSDARLASTKLERDSLKDALVVANILNGKLIAAAKLHITPREIHDIVFATDTTSEGVRTATFRDSTTEGILSGRIQVPPLPDKIKLDYSFILAPLDLTVSLVQLKDNSAVFAVRYRGGVTNITTSYAKLEPSPKFLSTYIEALYNPIAIGAEARVGLQSLIPIFKPRGWYLIGELSERFKRNSDSDNNIYFGVRKVF